MKICLCVLWMYEEMSSSISSKLLKLGHSVQPSAFAVVTHPLWRFIQSALECIHFTNFARLAQRSCSRNSFQIFQYFFFFFNKVLEESEQLNTRAICWLPERWRSSSPEPSVFGNIFKIFQNLTNNAKAMANWQIYTNKWGIWGMTT